MPTQEETILGQSVPIVLYIIAPTIHGNKLVLIRVTAITHGLYAEEDVFDKEDLDDILILINCKAEESD